MDGNATINAIKWCDDLKFNRFRGLALAVSSLILLFDGYASTVILYLIPHFMREWRKRVRLHDQPPQRPLPVAP